MGLNDTIRVFLPGRLHRKEKGRRIRKQLNQYISKNEEGWKWGREKERKEG